MRSPLRLKNLRPQPALIELPSLAPAGDTLAKISEDIGDCKRCRLCEQRNKIVFGSGNEQARLVFVGEGPGADEDAQGSAVRGTRGAVAHADDRRHGFEGRHSDQARGRLHLQRGEVPASGEPHAAAGRNGDLRAIPVPPVDDAASESDLRVGLDGGEGAAGDQGRRHAAARQLAQVA